MRARKGTPVDIIYDRYSPIVVYEVIPERGPNEGGMTGIEEPKGSTKCWCDHCEMFDIRTIWLEPARSFRQREIQFLKYRRTSAFICRRSLGYNLK